MKTIRHKWINRIGDHKDHKCCIRCQCHKMFDFEFGKTIFYDRFGKLHLITPSCILPNTLI